MRKHEAGGPVRSLLFCVCDASQARARRCGGRGGQCNHSVFAPICENPPVQSLTNSTAVWPFRLVTARYGTEAAVAVKHALASVWCARTSVRHCTSCQSL